MNPNVCSNQVIVSFQRRTRYSQPRNQRRTTRQPAKSVGLIVPGGTPNHAPQDPWPWPPWLSV